MLTELLVTIIIFLPCHRDLSTKPDCDSHGTRYYELIWMAKDDGYGNYESYGMG